MQRSIRFLLAKRLIHFFSYSWQLFTLPHFVQIIYIKIFLYILLQQLEKPHQKGFHNTVNQLYLTSSSRTFLVANQQLMYGCFNMTGLDKAWSQTLVVANQFIGSKSRNKVVANNSWFTVSWISSETTSLHPSKLYKSSTFHILFLVLDKEIW